MMWLTRLKNQKSPDTHPTKPTKPYFVGFVGAHMPVFEKTHLQSGGDDSGDHPLLKAVDDLKHSGIELVPEDRRYIREKIGHRMNWAALLDGYKWEWLAAMDGCLPHQKQNRGRFAANTWLGRDDE